MLNEWCSFGNVYRASHNGRDWNCNSSNHSKITVNRTVGSAFPIIESTYNATNFTGTFKNHSSTFNSSMFASMFAAAPSSLSLSKGACRGLESDRGQISQQDRPDAWLQEIPQLPEHEFREDRYRIAGEKHD